MTGAEVIQRLRATKDRREIAKRSGVPYGTVVKIACGITKNPRNDSIDALRAYFLALEPRKRRAQ
jgi:transcriptional regulator with XRE-family HTH domain